MKMSKQGQDLDFDSLFEDEFSLFITMTSRHLYDEAIKKSVPAKWLPGKNEMSEDELAIALWDMARGFMRVLPDPS